MGVKWNRVNEQFRYEFNSSNFVDWIWFDFIIFSGVESDGNKNGTHYIELMFDRSLRFYRRSERFLLALLSQSTAVVLELCGLAFGIKKITLLTICTVEGAYFIIMYISLVETNTGKIMGYSFAFAFASVTVFLSSYGGDFSTPRCIVYFVLAIFMVLSHNSFLSRKQCSLLVGQAECG